MTAIEWMQGITVAAGFLATIVGIIFAVLAFVAWNELRNFDRRIKKETERLEDSVASMSKASQKLTAGYEQAIAKHFDEAIKLYHEAERIYPRLYNVNNALGWAYLEKGQVDAAIEAFRSAQKTRPNDIESYSDLAYAYMKKGDLQAALKAISDTLKRDASQTEYFKTSIYDPLKEDPTFRQLVGLN
ncbi:MAG: tetratricopeptide repeat protein [Chloroflexi bacterium]|nr:tetratricopeptide repeat protein [Chloroflexota bacterium]